MPVEYTTRQIHAIRWDGTNGAEVAAVCQAIDVDDSTWTMGMQNPGQHLRLLQRQGTKTSRWIVPWSTPWVVVAHDFGILGFLSDAQYAARFKSWSALGAGLLADPSFMTNLMLELPVYSLAVAHGRPYQMPALTLVAANHTAVVTLDKTMPNTAYEVHWQVKAGASILSQVQLQNIANPIVRTTTTVTLYLRTVGLASAAGTLDVQAYALVAS